jgi:hypothetical protein
MSVACHYYFPMGSANQGVLEGIDDDQRLSEYLLLIIWQSPTFTRGRCEVKSISGSKATPVASLTWSQELGKRIRSGPWPDQAVSTTRKVVEAIQEEQWEVAAQLVDYWMEEAKVVYVIYKVWTDGFIAWLHAQDIEPVETESEVSRLKTLLSFPDGGPYEPRPRWEQLSLHAGRLTHMLRAYELTASEAITSFEALREKWRQLHDRGADMMWGLLTFVSKRFGEAEIEACFRFVLEPYLEERYRPFDLREQSYESTLFRNLYLTFEAMRGHLSGPGRTGDLEFKEYDDRWEISFNPCGSGNRALRGDDVEGTSPRTDAPYNFGTTRQRYDWAWNETGICYYCAHCCFALERWPAEQWGHPIRVVNPPRYVDKEKGIQPKKCTWTIYKSTDAIPEEAYRRIGLKKPC